jgi:hypothetical protein
VALRRDAAAFAGVRAIGRGGEHAGDDGHHSRPRDERASGSGTRRRNRRRTLRRGHLSPFRRAVSEGRARGSVRSDPRRSLGSAALRRGCGIRVVAFAARPRLSQQPRLARGWLHRRDDPGDGVRQSR